MRIHAFQSKLLLCLIGFHVQSHTELNEHTKDEHSSFSSGNIF